MKTMFSKTCSFASLLLVLTLTLSCSNDDDKDDSSSSSSNSGNGNSSSSSDEDCEYVNERISVLEGHIRAACQENYPPELVNACTETWIQQVKTDETSDIKQLYDYALDRGCID